MMKNILFLIILFIFSVSFSQIESKKLISDKQDLISLFNEYIKAVNESDFEKQHEFLPDFVFDSISKKESIEFIKEFYSNGNRSKTNIDSFFSIDTIITKNKIKYARINVQQDIIMDFSVSKEEKGIAYVLAMYLYSMEIEYGEENVKYDEDEYLFYINSNNPIYGIKYEKENWKFIEVSEIEIADEDNPIELKSLKLIFNNIK